MNTNKAIRLFLFGAITLTWSYFYFRTSFFSYPEENLAPELLLTEAWMPALGLFITALILRHFLGPLNTNSLFGGSPKWSLLIIALPVIGLTIIGVPNIYDLQPNYAGFILGMVTVFYTLFEEYGWRGYLQQEINIDQEWIKYSIIGFWWYFWHWSFLGNPDIMTNLIFLGLIIFGSLGIGRLADQTQSILVCAAFHAIGNIGFLFSLIRDNLAIEKRVLLLVICIAAWAYIIKIWDKEKAQQNIAQ